MARKENSAARVIRNMPLASDSTATVSGIVLV